MANIFLCSYFAEVASKINEVVDFQGKHVAFIDTAAKFEEVNFYVDEAVKILEKFENEELSLDDSIAEYEKAIKLIKDSEKLLEVGEGKVLKVLEKNGKLETEEVE